MPIVEFIKNILAAKYFFHSHTIVENRFLRLNGSKLITYLYIVSLSDLNVQSSRFSDVRFLDSIDFYAHT